jgi:hypothetical protein
VLIAAKTGQAGVVFFARSRLTGVCLVDCEQGPLSPALLNGVVARLLDLTATCSARHDPAIFSTSELVQAVERLGYRGEAIDGVVADPTLAVSAAVHVGAGRVRVCEGVLSKTFPLTFLLGSAALQDDDDPLRTAFLAGLAVALDTGRDLGRAHR